MAAFRTLHAFRSAKKLFTLSTTKSINPYRNYLLSRSKLNYEASYQLRFFSSQTQEKTDEPSDSHSIISGSETTGEKSKYSFQSDTKMLLDIVAKSLYSEKEVFLRELLSNASDALEKLRYNRLTDQETLQSDNRDLEIRIATDKQKRLLIIQDTGIGMTEDELKENIGTIAHSGSKAFVKQLKEKGATSGTSDIIGQFGVGFYSAFMVAEKIEIFTKSHKTDQGVYWTSDGSGSYEIAKADKVEPGTKIMLHLRPENREFSDETTVINVIKRYSNFISSPIFVNGKQANIIKPLWLMDANEISKEQHTEFYRFISGSYDEPRFILSYVTDAPLSIRAILYVPKEKPSLFDFKSVASTGVALYSRKVLIKSKMENILAPWLRFVKGVVDSEDIPLNLSRELLQDSALIAKLRRVLTMRVIKYLQDRMSKEPEQFLEFHKDYHPYLKEGIISSDDHSEKEEISKLLMFETSLKKPGELCTITDYCKNLAKDQKDIYYLSAPNRTLAEQSPYMESFKKRNLEVLFCYEPYDEVVLMHLRQFKDHVIISAEKDMQTAESKSETNDLFNTQEVKDLMSYIKETLKEKVHEVKTTDRLENHPCAITVQDMASARHFIRLQTQKFSDEMRYTLLQPKLEINVKHPLIKKLMQLRTSDPKIAELLTEQLFMNSMVSAGLVEDSRVLLTTMNQLLTLILDK